jgi:riboflavin kinase/FMN adenylyltransferase
MPPAGVYAAFVRCGRLWLSAAVNIGARPTVGPSKKAVCEVHIIGWKKDITGRKIDVVFLKKLRNERKFASKNLLIQAISKDIRTITTRYSSPSKILHNLL